MVDGEGFLHTCLGWHTSGPVYWNFRDSNYSKFICRFLSYLQLWHFEVRLSNRTHLLVRKKKGSLNVFQEKDDLLPGNKSSSPRSPRTRAGPSWTSWKINRNGLHSVLAMASFCRPIPAFHLSQVTSLVFSKFRSFVPSAYYRQGMSSPSPKHSPLASAFPINWERAHVFWNSEEGLSLARFIVGARLCVTGRFISQLSLFWSTILPEVSESVTVRIAWLLCGKKCGRGHLPRKRTWQASPVSVSSMVCVFQ